MLFSSQKIIFCHPKTIIETIIDFFYFFIYFLKKHKTKPTHLHGFVIFCLIKNKIKKLIIVSWSDNISYFHEEVEQCVVHIDIKSSVVGFKLQCNFCTLSGTSHRQQKYLLIADLPNFQEIKLFKSKNHIDSRDTC
jgi:hypothetical protein